MTIWPGSLVFAAALLTPAYLAVGVLAYWALIDTAAPLDHRYLHPRFVDRWVTTRDEAARHEVLKVKPDQAVFTYEEYCVANSRVGTVSRRWSNGTVIHLPETRTAAAPGCYQRSFRVQAPDKPGIYAFRKEFVYHNNPLTDSGVLLPTVELEVAW